jgi:phage N-6-adenine-methyltransferase
MAATTKVPGKPKTDAELLASLAVKRAAIRDHVSMVAQHRLTGVFLHGPSGTGKTRDVEETLEKVIPGNWLVPPSHVTPGGLPELMEDYISGVLFLDDQLKLLKSDVAQQHLCAALGHNPEGVGVRPVTYKRQGQEAKTIPYCGGIVIATNLKEVEKVAWLQPLLSRIPCVFHNPTNDEIEAMMRRIAGRGWQGLTPTECMRVCTHLLERTKANGCDPDLRHLTHKALPAYLQWALGQTELHWHDLVEIAITESIRKESHPLRQVKKLPSLKKQQMEADRKVAAEVWQKYPKRQDRRKRVELFCQVAGVKPPNPDSKEFHAVEQRLCRLAAEARALSVDLKPDYALTGTQVQRPQPPEVGAPTTHTSGRLPTQSGKAHPNDNDKRSTTPKVKDGLATPQWLFDLLNALVHEITGQWFQLDAAAQPGNAKCAHYFDAEVDALRQDWSAWGTIFCNPPFTRRLISQFVEKALQTADQGSTVVLVLPAWTGYPWFQAAKRRAQMHDVIGPVAFRRADGKQTVLNNGYKTTSICVAILGPSVVAGTNGEPIARGGHGDRAASS